ncbi:hypothetical protein TELCIR_04260 [Teladorsagia circumcincta]|uniref:HNF-p1 domain-containing protein n=1 Tax=Teladorsagia circumcincta TaxID=45464 RepID=A0A2G9UW78_TELCI|nr:hypothetical protein TELCIR_04260 [Teladorsagia circumcincta]
MNLGGAILYVGEQDYLQMSNKYCPYGSKMILFTVEQLELIRRLRSTGISPAQVAEIPRNFMVFS